MPPVKLSALVGVLALLVAACGPAAAPTPTTLAPTATAMRATPAPTATRAPGATPIATPTLSPSPTPAAGPKYGGVLRGYVPWDMAEWDVQREAVNAWPMNYTANAVFSKVVTFEQAKEGRCDNPVVPVLAESYKYLDTQTLDVTLRPGVKFHNKAPVSGREFTAQDLVWNWTRLKEVARGQLAATVGRIDKIEATGPRTVRFTFKQPFSLAVPTMLGFITGPFMYAPEAAGTDGNYRDPYKSWIGTGPLMFKEWRPGVKIVFTRNPDYFKAGKPYIDGAELLVMPDESTRMAALMSGKLDLIWRISPSGVQALRKTRPDININGCPYSIAFGFIAIRTDKAPFNDVRVRRAMSMAIDRQTLMDTLFGGEGEILTLVPSMYGEYSLAPKDLAPEIRRYMEYRPDEARKLLAEAGFPTGLTTTLETTRQFGSPFNESQEAMLDMWAKIGVKVEAKWYEFVHYSSFLASGDYANMLWARASRVAEPYNLSSFHSKSGWSANLSHVVDPEVDKLADSFLITFDEKEQARISREIQRRVVEQAYVIMQPSPLEYGAIHAYVRGFGTMSHMSRSYTLYERIWFNK